MHCPGPLETDALLHETAPDARQRMASLDVFRGICLALMVVVNAGGGGFAWYVASASRNTGHACAFLEARAAWVYMCSRAQAIPTAGLRERLY
jgi:hypothetical protein